MASKLQFESDLDYQRRAIDGVCDLFDGQQTESTTFTVLAPGRVDQATLAGMESEMGRANPEILPNEALLANLRRVQVRNGLAPAADVESHNFTVEMETGTGKTYVYFRTIYELHKKYGFSRFIAVVPSVAIREGTLSALQGMRSHLEELYDGVPLEAFIYNSRDLGAVRNFATGNGLQLMIMTVAAMSRNDVVLFRRPTEALGGRTPADVVKEIHPVVIVDEPQSVTGGPAGREAVEDLGARFSVGYSATHRDPHHMVYRLSPVDAYREELVKQIEVASVVEDFGFNEPFVGLLAVRREGRRGPFSAKVELHRQTEQGTKVSEVVVRPGDDLREVTGRAVYEHHSVGEMTMGTRRELGWIMLNTPDGPVQLEVGAEHEGVDPELLVRVMMRETIREHLDKEARLRSKGVKVLSLFFLKRVEDYRGVVEGGERVQGLFEQIFEQEFIDAMNVPAFRGLFDEDEDPAELAAAVHDGYFSQDRHGVAIDTNEGNQAGRKAARDAYELIMRDKERLLDLGTPLRFIFSHSALREGWDNPNVFQICSLREIRTERERRQTLGRGLRICFDQDGRRVKGFDVNRLTVIANEQYEDYARRLQREMEDEEGQRFGFAEKHRFAPIFLQGREDDEAIEQALERSAALFAHLQEAGYLDDHGRVTDQLRTDISEEELDVPGDFMDLKEEIVEDLTRLCGTLEVENARDRVDVRVRQDLLEDEPFSELWRRINQRTSYSLDFSDDELVERCVDELDPLPAVAVARLRVRGGRIVFDEAGIGHEDLGEGAPVAAPADFPLPDLLRIMEERTGLTRRTLFRILQESDRLRHFRRNPQGLIDLTTEAILKAKRLTFAEGVSYQSLGESESLDLSIFAKDQGTAYKDKSWNGCEHSVIEPIPYDSKVEKDFAEALELHRDVRVYAKLPAAYRIATPLGTYNPDWAVVFESQEGKRLYKVIETKGTTELGDLRRAEAAKIHCAKCHYGAIATDVNPAQYQVAHRLTDVELDYEPD